MKKRIDHWCSVVPEKSQPSGPPFSGKLGKPRFPLEWWALGWDFSVPTEHQWWILFISHTPYQPVGKIKIEQLHVEIQVTSSECCHYVSVLSSFWEPFFKYKNAIFNCVQEKIHYLCEDGIENSVPRDHHLSSLSKPCDVKRWSSGQIFSQCSVSRRNVIK